jgi:hypothetical protein
MVPSSSNVRPCPRRLAPLLLTVFDILDRRLAQHTRLLNARNQTLLRATGAARPNPNSSTVLVGEESVLARALTWLESVH